MLTQSYPDLPEEKDAEVSPPQVRLFTTVKKKGVEVTEYSDTYANLICTMLAEGWLLSKLAELPGMPSLHTITIWKGNHPQFTEALKIAYQARAELMADKAIEVADQSTWKTAKSDALKIDTVKWIAEKSDPERFGNKKNDQGNTFNFFVTTGFEVPGGKIVPVEIDKRDPSIVLQELDRKEE